MVVGKCAPWIVTGMLALFCGLGCKREAGEQSTPKPVAAGSLAPRFNAAMEITTSSDRDEAMSSIALDAGGLGDGKMVVQALENIRSTDLRDGTAGKAAIKLAAAGKHDDAKTVAMTIRSSELRNDALKKLAKGG